MKSHTTQGCDLLEKIPELRECEAFPLICDVCRHHHRTLTTYLDTLLRNGFQLQHVVEPQPPEHMIDIPGMKDELRRPMMLHDVGKRAIPQEILNKPGNLTQEEFEVMKSHTTQGCDLLVGSVVHEKLLPAQDSKRRFYIQF